MNALLSVVPLFGCIILSATIGQATREISNLPSIDGSLTILLFVLVVSYNQPRFCSNASWNPNAITFAAQAVAGVNPYAIFITTKNTIVVPRRDNGQILIWKDNASGTPTSTIPAGPSTPVSAFVTSDEHIFVNQGVLNDRVDKWTLNGTRLSSTFFNCFRCTGLFVDVNNRLYCSAYDRHQVMRQSLSAPSSVLTVVAGVSCSGSTDEMLNGPYGIFVTLDLDLYVADYGNSRVQLFRAGQRNGTTVAGSGANGTIQLNGPSGIAVDADGYLFIVDWKDHRIVGSDRNGFRCLVGCSKVAAAGASQLNNPFTMSFDTDGNIFVTDWRNSRIQKFLLMNNSCGRSQSANSLVDIEGGVFHWRDEKHQCSSSEVETLFLTTNRFGCFRQRSFVD